ncbi:MAG TPA: response regulator transcription factor [Acidimicrobiales bacterium]|jgi:DNA-binding response OmpR family regulator|nr:response regulator transcription factor [Acidimicrobiales bacterium]
MAPKRDARILVVDDDPQLRSLLQLVLEGEGYPVTLVSDAPSAVAEVEKAETDLVVLDVSLGVDDGRLVLARIREQGELPVILISGKGDTADRVLGLRLGADDFLPKPFSPVELVARVETVLRRSARTQPGPAVAAPAGPVEASGLRVDEMTRDVTIDGQPIDLTAKEFDLLAFLARSPRQVFSRGQLLEHVWSSRSEWQDEATVTEHVRRVRHKIEQDPAKPRWITTVRGVGYRFEP